VAISGGGGVGGTGDGTCVGMAVAVAVAVAVGSVVGATVAVGSVSGVTIGVIGVAAGAGDEPLHPAATNARIVTMPNTMPSLESFKSLPLESTLS
jgi:hypothetical protein